MSKMKTVVSVSGGAGSAVALARCLEKFSDVVAVFCDTKSEAPDLYELLDAIDERFGISIIRLDQGMNIWECFRKFRAMSLRLSAGACKASVELKQKPFAAWLKENHPDPATVQIAAGLSWMEQERQAKFAKKYLPYSVIYPLNDQPRLSDCQIVDELRKLGLPVPEAYEKGYAHNNCGGACILAGLRQWAGLRLDYPERFEKAAQEEELFIKEIGKDFTVLRDQRNGTTKPYTLRQFEKDLDAGRNVSDNWRSSCGCMQNQLSLFNPPPSDKTEQG